MRGSFARIALICACLGLMAALGSLLGLSQQVGQASQVTTTLGIDTDPTGNNAASLGEIDPCVSVASGETFDVDIFITDVVNLGGWQAIFNYDASVIRLAQTDVELFLAQFGSARVLDLSDIVPDEDGVYNFAVADMTPGDVGHSGSGVLTRVTLQAVGPGVSFLTLEENLLFDATAEVMGDVTGDDVFDGSVILAQVWVDEPCPSSLLTPTPRPSPTAGPPSTPPGTATPSPPPATGEPASPIPATADGQPPSVTEPSEDGDNGGFPWVVLAGAGAATIVAALAAALVFRWLLRRAG